MILWLKHRAGSQEICALIQALLLISCVAFTWESLSLPSHLSWGMDSLWFCHCPGTCFCSMSWCGIAVAVSDPGNITAGLGYLCRLCSHTLHQLAVLNWVAGHLVRASWRFVNRSTL